jgi:branched-chain amino acid transport system permease protein
MTSVVIQLLNGLANASTLFLTAAGLSLIFGVTRIVNFAHGSLYMLGIYCAYSFIGAFGVTAWGFWGGVVAAVLAVGAFGALVEIALLRRIYRAPELFQLLATFALSWSSRTSPCGSGGPRTCSGRARPGCAARSRFSARPSPSTTWS